jgi:shikimate dehydrogenase
MTARRGRTRVFGVVGASVAHSLSPAMHAAAFDHLAMDAVYLPFDVPAGAFARALYGAQALGLWGLNVTAPHKEQAFALSHRASAQAARAGAANVLRLGPDGAIECDNTDGMAITDAVRLRLPGWPLDPGAPPALVLGAGGAARVAAVALADLGATVAVTARRSDAVQALARLVRSHGGEATEVAWTERGRAAAEAAVVVQATPLGGGTRPRGDALGDAAAGQGLLVEMAYGPEPTPLERRWAAAGGMVVDGRELLARQGAHSWHLWLGIEGPLDVMWRAIARTPDVRRSTGSRA